MLNKHGLISSDSNFSSLVVILLWPAAFLGFRIFNFSVNFSVVRYSSDIVGATPPMHFWCYPPLHQSQYCLRNQDVIGRLNARTEKFKSTFYPNCLSEWNKLEPELRLAPSIAVFKKKLLSIIRPPAKSVYGIHDPK